ncbi:MAG: guanylate kinase [Prevotellaceae bacterium]|jgi:guanylate kinase|nr:guanylate kinase [Prevotellaceae bacterium]
MEKVIIFSAPSGSGKTTVVQHLLATMPALEFSISATSRAPRAGEVCAKDYYFMSSDEFKERIDRGEFIEWEEVYPGKYYGTPKSEPKRIWGSGKLVLFDVDVYGGLSLKKIFGDRALLLFIMPPSLAELRRRLVGRSTDSLEVINERMARAEHELSFSSQFDRVIVNDRLDQTIAEAEQIINEFAGSR